MSSIIQALKLLALGTILGVTLGVFLGFPSSTAQDSEQTACFGPIPSTPLVQWITPAQARLLLDNTDVRFVDARNEDAFQQGHITGAIHLPLENGVLSESRLTRLKGTRTIITYCDTQGSCSASRRVASLLFAAGFTDVRVLEGGMPAWIQAKYPAQAGACNDC